MLQEIVEAPERKGSRSGASHTEKAIKTGLTVSLQLVLVVLPLETLEALALSLALEALPWDSKIAI